jgi:hypothetical protein
MRGIRGRIGAYESWARTPDRLTGLPVRGHQINSQPISQSPAPSMYPPGQIRAPYPYPPPPPSPRRNHAMVVALVAIALMAVGLCVLVVVGLYIFGRSNTRWDEHACGGCGRVPAGFLSASESTRRTWHSRARLTSRVHSKNYRVSDAPVPSERYGAICIVQFSSSGAARNEAATESALGATATAVIGGKSPLFCAPADWTGASLQPLAHFGFVITPTR